MKHAIIAVGLAAFVLSSCSFVGKSASSAPALTKSEQAIVAQEEQQLSTSYGYSGWSAPTVIGVDPRDTLGYRAIYLIARVSISGQPKTAPMLILEDQSGKVLGCALMVPDANDAVSAQ